MSMLEETPSPLCFAVWFTLGFLGNLPSKGRMQNDTKVAYACSLSETALQRTDCIILNLMCDDTHRIQIINANYSLGTQSNISVSSTNRSQCVDKINNQCFGLGSKKCCAPGDHALYPYLQTHKYYLFNKCSWQQTCESRAIYLNEHSDFCAVQYQCAPETNVSFCNATDVTGDNISLIYNSSITTDAHVTCWCIVNSKDSYNIKFQDLRFVDKAGKCIESVSLRISALERQINCSMTGGDNHLIELQTLVNISGYLEIELTLPANQNPQMIWIQAEAWNQGSINAKCFSNNQRPPTTQIPSTTLSSTIATYYSGVLLNSSTALVLPNMTSTTSSLTNEVIPESNSTTVVMGTSDNSIPSTEGSTQALGSTPDGQTVNAPSSGEVPMAAIITPVVLLVMIGTGVVIVAIVFWRKRRKMNDKLDGIDGNNYDKVKKQSEEEHNNYDNCVPSTTPIKTNDNYIILNSESDYNYIDHKDAQKSESNQEISKSSGIPLQMQEPGVSNHSASGLHNSYVPDNVGSSTKYVKSGKMKVGNPNYFVLEPSGLSLTGQKDSLSALEQRIERTDVNITPDAPNGESHNHFNLHLQNAPGESLEPHKLKKDVASQDVERTANNYFVLEPQDTYSSIDPNDVVVQTLPDDEYNVLNIKSQGTEKFLKYTGLKSHHVDNKAQACEDYSHIVSSAVGNKDILQEYSHINLDNTHAASNEASGNEYSHLGSVMTNQSSQSAEGSDYAHLQKKLP